MLYYKLFEQAKPILFNTEMVRAILEGKKTVTRRVIKPQPEMPNYLGFTSSDGINRTDAIFSVDGDQMSKIERRTPKYKIGNILYVRETWQFVSCEECGGNCAVISGDTFKGKKGCYAYRTNYGTTEDDSFPPSMFKWRPSIHMPKEAARIFLRVTDVRVERLQDILNDPSGPQNQVVKEGCIYTCDFIALWQNTTKKSDRQIYGWDANPWVWVYEFEKLS